MNIAELKNVLMSEYDMDFPTALAHIQIAYAFEHVEFYHDDVNISVVYDKETSEYKLGAIEIYCCQWVPHPIPGHETRCDKCGSVFSVRQD